jgi:hydrogenase maturation protease
VSRASQEVLVLGIGNLLMSDDGVGVHVVRQLSAQDPPQSGVRIVDGGTLGLDLLPLVADAEALVVVDAVDMAADPGTVRLLRGPELHAILGGHVSPHQEGLGDLIAVGRLTDSLPELFTLVGIQPASVGVGIELSPECAAALPRALAAVRAEVETFRATAAPA